MVHIEVVHQTFFGKQDGFFCGAANTNAQHTWRAPTRAHGGNCFEHPIDHAVAGVQHDHLGFVFAAAAFGCDDDVQGIARHDLREDHGRRVVFGVFTGELGVVHDRRAQSVVRMVVTTAHTFVDGVF